MANSPQLALPRTPATQLLENNTPGLQGYRRSTAQFGNGFKAASPDDFTEDLRCTLVPGRVENRGPSTTPELLESHHGFGSSSSAPDTSDPNHQSSTGPPARADEPHPLAGGKAAARRHFYPAQTRACEVFGARLPSPGPC